MLCKCLKYLLLGNVAFARFKCPYFFLFLFLRIQTEEEDTAMILEVAYHLANCWPFFK